MNAKNRNIINSLFVGYTVEFLDRKGRKVRGKIHNIKTKNVIVHEKYAYGYGCYKVPANMLTIVRRSKVVA